MDRMKKRLLLLYQQVKQTTTAPGKEIKKMKMMRTKKI